MRRIAPLAACLVLLMSLAATTCGPARAADLDGTYVPRSSDRPPPDRRYRRPPPPPPPPEVVYGSASANAQGFRLMPRRPFIDQPFLIDPYAPSIVGAPLSPPTYGYGY